METNLNSWFHNQSAHQQISYINSLNLPLSLGQLNHIPPLWNPSENIAWLKGTLNDKKSAFFPCENSETVNIAGSGSRPAQKRFLVFDQSGDQTTMFYTPAMSPPVKLLSEVPIPKPELVYATHNILNREKFHHHDPIFAYPNNEIQRDDTESEMHEDTEELNALLYSDDEYYEDEEEASTGHSPSTLTHFDRDCGSNFGPNKRIKLSPLSSDDPKFCFKCEDDAESSCGDGQNLNLGAKKRSRRDEIRETLSLLQKIIPCEKGINKDAILIFDEAIDYLKSLKEKALDLGVHAI